MILWNILRGHSFLPCHASAKFVQIQCPKRYMRKCLSESLQYRCEDFRAFRVPQGEACSVAATMLLHVFVCSPSDLDADFEDNQDYDSTVSQSETKLPMYIPSSRVDSVQEVESPTSADSFSTMRTTISDPTELQRVTSIAVKYF